MIFYSGTYTPYFTKFKQKFIFKYYLNQLLRKRFSCFFLSKKIRDRHKNYGRGLGETYTLLVVYGADGNLIGKARNNVD